MSRIEEQEVSRTWVGTLGIVFMSIGAVAFLLAIILFVLAYPERWYALGDYSVETSRMWVEFIVAIGWTGLLFMLPGLSFFFYGRSMGGRGRARDRHRVGSQEAS